MRLARPFIFFLRPHVLKYVRPVALSARHVFFIVGHPVAAAAICGLRYFRAHVCDGHAVMKPLPEPLFALNAVRLAGSTPASVL